MKRSHGEFNGQLSNRTTTPASATSLSAGSGSATTGIHAANAANAGITPATGSANLAAPTLQTVSRPAGTDETAALSTMSPGLDLHMSEEPIVELPSGPGLVLRSLPAQERQFSDVEQLPHDILGLLTQLVPGDTLLNMRSTSKTMLHCISVVAPEALDNARIESAEFKLFEAGNAVCLPDETVKKWIAAASLPLLSQSISRARLLVAMRLIMVRKHSSLHVVNLWKKQFDQVSDEDFVTCFPAIFLAPATSSSGECTYRCAEVLRMLGSRIYSVRPEWLSKLVENCISQTGASPADICQVQKVPALLAEPTGWELGRMLETLFGLAKNVPLESRGAYVRKLLCAVSAYDSVVMEEEPDDPYEESESISFVVLKNAFAGLTVTQAEDIVKDYLDEIEARTDAEHRWRYLPSLRAAIQGLPNGSELPILDRAESLLGEPAVDGTLLDWFPFPAPDWIPLPE
ncbi:MAG: hypothetical protein JWR22_4171 [Herminiimonas sp.]|nr:hypothetical protein [Herminiimonas sp.]